MRRSQRLIAAAVLVSLSGVLAGCSDSLSKLSDWDPTDMLDFLDTKKKIPGERKPVFPEGVPGLEQGVPKELYKGSQQEQIDQQNAQAAAAASAPAAAPKSKQARSRSKQPATAEAAAAGEDGSTPPKPKKVVHHHHTTKPPPAQQTAQPAQPAHRAAGAITAAGAAIRRAIPGADAERHLYALDFGFHVFCENTRARRARVADVLLHDCHYRPAQCREIDAVQSIGRPEAGAGR